MSNQRTRRGQRGFTLVEVMVALGIMVFLFFGAAAMFLMSLQTTARVQADTASSADAANAMHQIMDDLREAAYFSLPDDSNSTQAQNNSNFVYPTSPKAYGWSAFTTVVNGTTIDTGVMLVAPGTQPQTITVANSSGASLAVSPTPYNRDTTVGAAYSTTMNYIYRADRDGTPDPSAGQYVAWASANSSGGAFTVNRTRKISDIPASGAALNAVQFVRATDASGNPQKYEMEAKIVSSYYSPINNMQTNERTNGARVTQLTGKCVMMRDHELGTAYEPNTGSGGASSGRWSAN